MPSVPEIAFRLGGNLAVMVPIALVSAQYEPTYAQSYPSCLWKSAMYDHRCGNYPGFTPDNPTPMDTFNSSMAVRHAVAGVGGGLRAGELSAPP